MSVPFAAELLTAMPPPSISTSLGAPSLGVWYAVGPERTRAADARVGHVRLPAQKTITFSHQKIKNQKKRELTINAVPPALVVSIVWTKPRTRSGGSSPTRPLTAHWKMELSATQRFHSRGPIVARNFAHFEQVEPTNASVQSVITSTAEHNMSGVMTPLCVLWVPFTV